VDKFEFTLYQGKYMTDVKKRRTISIKELPEYRGYAEDAIIHFSQDEEYLFMASFNGVYIIRIG
jgi:hypothetical protein